MNRTATTAVVAVGQLVLVGLAVAPQLSARLNGDTYALRVAPLDPIDPFRGAYVSLDYPDLHRGGPSSGEQGIGSLDDGTSGDLFITLRRDGAVWVGDDWTRERPEDGPYLACNDQSWQVRCGIESWFLPQDEATRTEDLLRDGAVAEVRIDGRGNAAVVDVRAP
ncbi:GDYXXLXY domain-containing protein [Nocardioides okcheonensis]|uniref:GDYXXLXY domain-containing protein n=1 Tax=Nocardioides okcheonensis TaxID=2894081 RepID=UPI001E51C112|nr:GDYXXLXY domain-containing protein [Nocardioides okcheonensis]UFN43720.1 GDYXXLXY domain-containing protein [Nocardioides okcheonensis]